MPDIKAERLTSPYDGATVIYKWPGVTENDVCLPVILPIKGDKTFQAEGTFGGTSLRLRGTVDPAQAAMYQLRDPQGNDIILSAAGMRTVLENCYAYQPHLVGGASVALDLYLLAQGG